MATDIVSGIVSNLFGGAGASLYIDSNILRKFEPIGRIDLLLGSGRPIAITQEIYRETVASSHYRFRTVLKLGQVRT